ncbi:testis-expressed protein 2-like isoform X1 [Salvelinus fontinalis]|uniref:testis-expressed protein 2-like isoform X1 n=1 Tax=Salvelinus fontinalis TaxID=8038 RepID=UPI00248690E7|nr:testis-expressed protein 2-like isoform X1 [Salvelinus fontinalis]XP_055754626.1 testis-expressed protein 2-like isoform X1 [Salvelinus fontinalis]XP_055754627.1 testis-expressed protein 2-like isoform X1 [Salvelinus fontinalis]
MEDSELIFLERHDEGEGPTVAFSKDKPGVREARDSRPDSGLGLGLGLKPGQGRRSSGFHIPLSPSSPGSLADLAMASSPPPGLVKSSSTELQTKETGSLRSSKPLFSLVKSLSTEISHLEPEVYLSKSDSKLHMHPWKQFTQTQPKLQEAGSGNDSWMAPPSPVSPTEPKGSSLMTEFEDTRRKFSEAIQDPMSMWGKMMGDESSSGSPKQKVSGGVGDSPASLGSYGGGGSGIPLNIEDGSTETQVRYRRGTDSELGVCETPLRRPRRGPLKPSLSPEHHSQLGDSLYEICTNGDLIQVIEVQGGGSSGAGTRGQHRGTRPQARGRIPGVPVASVPVRWLLFVGVLAYGFFVLPLPSYVTGLSLGLACGFLLGLVVVLVFTPRPRSRALPPWGTTGARWSQDNSLLHSDPVGGPRTDAEVLEGWMNEMPVYDPETYHPSLTHSVYATLEGSCLRLAYPRTNIPRRAAFDELPHEAVFLRSRCYQLANCKVSLLPAALARKRVWNKKYPICIILAEGEVGREEEERVEEGQEEEERTDKQTLPDTQTQGLPDTLYLFGRTGREKEDWFQHFLLASRSEFKSSPIRDVPKSEVLCSGSSSMDSTENLPPLIGLSDLVDYGSYMSRLIGLEGSSPSPSPCHSDQGSPTARKKFPSEEASTEGGCPAEGQPAWVNALVGRIFWDFLREKYWVDLVAHKIQKKLSKIRLPYFVNELKLADLDMGTCIPQALSISKPSLDHRGLWLEMEVVYTGCLQMTLETKLNLCKLGKERSIGVEADGDIPETSQVGSKPRLCVLADSDEESSSAGSSDEEEVPPTEPQGTLGDKSTGTPPPPATDGGGSTGRRFLRFVDKIASSKYFQKATENEYIKKKIAEVSNMPLMLTVEVLELSGTLAVNIPPPPTDRIWYSFRVPPRLDLRVRPMLGEREVTFTHVTEWIEKKLSREFQKEFVMPNMDDLYLPLMSSVLDNPPAAQYSPAHSSRRSSNNSQYYVSE